ncbi:hypothetical protein ACFX2G_037161 [Malus domestica]
MGSKQYGCCCRRAWVENIAQYQYAVVSAVPPFFLFFVLSPSVHATHPNETPFSCLIQAFSDQIYRLRLFPFIFSSHFSASAATAMLCGRSRCLRTVGTLVGPHNSTGKALACEPTSHFSEQPLTSSELSLHFPHRFPQQTPTQVLILALNSKLVLLTMLVLMIQIMGLVVEKKRVVDDSDDGDDGDDADLTVLDSSSRVHEKGENFRRVEGDEKEFRHPLVRESQSDERVALKFFYWADRQGRYKHQPVVYHAMLEVLSKTKLCQGTKRVLRLMARRGIERSPEAFGYVMVSYSRAGKLRHALRVLTLMQKAGVELDVSMSNTAIHVLVMGNKLEKALRVLERMQLIGITPNVVTYNCLIKGYCDVHRVVDALELIDEMLKSGCAPDKEKRVKEVRELMEKMIKDGELLPDQVTYNNLVHMLSKHGYGDEALEFLREAEERGYWFDKVGYSAIVHSFCKDGCTPDVVIYTAVLDGYCRLGKVDHAKKMLQHMYKHGCRPNTVSYTALLNGLCRSQNSLEASEMMSTSEEEWWTPNAITYSVVMHGLRREGKLVEACDIVREMVNKGFFPYPVEINLLIQSLWREGKINEAKRFMEEYLSKGCAVNVVNFTTVIHGYCQKNDLDTALSLLDDMYLSNKHPDTVTYTTVINALGKNGRIQEATELMKKLLSKGLDPTPVTYRTIIHWVDELLQLLEKMFLRQNCKTAYNQVIEKPCSFGNLEEADKLLGKVLRTASRVDAKTCHSLMDGYLRKGNPLSAYKVAC